MKKILKEIQDGVFAREWMLECRATSRLQCTDEKGRRAPDRRGWGRLRAMMPWLKKGKLVDKSKA